MARGGSSRRSAASGRGRSLRPRSAISSTFAAKIAPYHSPAPRTLGRMSWEMRDDAPMPCPGSFTLAGCALERWWRPSIRRAWGGGTSRVKVFQGEWRAESGWYLL